MDQELFRRQESCPLVVADPPDNDRLVVNDICVITCVSKGITSHAIRGEDVPRVTQCKPVRPSSDDQTGIEAPAADQARPYF